MSIGIAVVFPRLRVKVRFGLEGGEYIAPWHWG